MFTVEWAWPWPYFGSLLITKWSEKRGLTGGDRTWNQMAEPKWRHRCVRAAANPRLNLRHVFLLVLGVGRGGCCSCCWLLNSGKSPPTENKDCIRKKEQNHRDSHSRHITLSNPHNLPGLLMNQGTESSSPNSSCQKQLRDGIWIEVCLEKLSLWFSFCGCFPQPITSQKAHISRPSHSSSAF